MSERRLPFLVETDWLQDHLRDPDLRILDCTVILRPVEGGMLVESGRPQWEQAHIPGAVFADVPGELSKRDTPLPVMMPPAAQFAEAMERYGVDDSSRVVLYDAGTGSWAARLWWMLRVFGFDAAAILNGGLKKWMAEGRPTVSGTDVPAVHARFTPRERSGLIADWKEVLAAVDGKGVRLINALSADEHEGKVTRVARPGHIPGSENVPAGSLIDPDTNTYLGNEALRQAFEARAAPGSGRTITYCGGGIAACVDAFVLTMLGVDDVAVYDGSLVEWSSRPELPMRTGASS
jgi:thiosulfate/3-mercaptopyruvate sulfurtransferase